MAPAPHSRIDRRPAVPLAVRVAGELEQRLLDGDYKPGDPFLTVRETLREFKVSFVTAQRALAQLAKQGWVTSQRGRGGTIVKRVRRKTAPRKCARTHVDERRIVVIWPTHESITSTFQSLFAPVLQGLRIALPAYNVSLEFPDEAALEENYRGYLKRLLKTNPHAAFCLATCPAYIKRYFAAKRVPAVVLGNLEPGIELSCVCADEERATYELARHVIELGHQRVAMAFGKPRVAGHLDRIRGYRKALLDAGPQADWQSRCEIAVRFKRETALRQFEILLNEPDAPTAALCTGPVIASWFKTVAGDSFHTAYDVNSDIFPQLPGSTTVMSWSGEEAGLQVGMLLKQQLDGDQRIQRRAVVYRAIRDYKVTV